MKRLTPWTFARKLVGILRKGPRIPPTLEDNPLLQTILKRRSIRSFTNQEIPEDVWAAILEAGRVAPSTVNLQTWTFLTFTPDQWRRIFDKPLPFGGATQGAQEISTARGGDGWQRFTNSSTQTSFRSRRIGGPTRICRGSPEWTCHLQRPLPAFRLKRRKSTVVIAASSSVSWVSPASRAPGFPMGC